MAVDLHLHSTYSDGSTAPAEIVARAAEIGLTGIALTDHDTLEGIPEASTAAAQHGIRLIAGTELSVEWKNQSMHMLAYFLDPGPGPLQNRMEELRHSRETRNIEIAAKLRQLGLEITMDEVAIEAGHGVVGRPHFAGVMIEKGYVENVPEAFDRYLAAGRPGYTPRVRLPVEEAIELAGQSGAVCSIAHPHTLNLRAEEFSTGFRHLVDVGLAGIEAYYGEYTPPLRDRIAEICEELGIVATGGSDYHGKYKPHLSIGIGKGDLRVPDHCFDRLEASR
ncbi:MAG: PHP domain-containing protein, partial [Acidimicrobiia bacterium]|nr:PHP domain-containing protein [Acidimicrobiia bacterium]